MSDREPDLDVAPLRIDQKVARRPKDAATLILVRSDENEPKILMGQRHHGHVFMPNKFVFPGGRVSACDNRITPATPLRADVEEKLRLQSKRENVQALALAAIRETFEEAGLLVGRKVDKRIGRLTRSKEWRPFFAFGVEPSLAPLQFIARAITPPSRARRFDARFFLADANEIQGDLHDTSNGDGELLDLHWFTFEEALALDLPYITRTVLARIRQRYEGTTPDMRPVFVRYANGKQQVDYL